MKAVWTSCDNPECGAMTDTLPLQWWDVDVSPPGAVRDELIALGRGIGPTDITITACSVRCLMIAFAETLDRLPVAG